MTDVVEGRSVLIAGNSAGCYLIARIGAETERAWWPTWRVDADGQLLGPQSLGNWIRFDPSDWRPVRGPSPAHVERAAGWVASLEDLDQVGTRDGRGWTERR